jgi:hypothetical protein
VRSLGLQVFSKQFQKVDSQSLKVAGAVLATADGGVRATHNLATACGDAITVHGVVDHVHVREVYAVRAARIGGAHPDPITVGRIAHPRDGCGTEVVVGIHPGVLGVANINTTTPFGPTIAVKLVVLEQGLVGLFS